MIKIYSGVLRRIIKNAKNDIKTIVLPESNDRRILEAANKVTKEKIANIVLIGNEKDVQNAQKKYGIVLEKNIKIVDPYTFEKTPEYAKKLYELRKEKGMTIEKANELIYDYNFFATMMLKFSDVDGMVSGACHSTAETLKPALQVIKQKENLNSISSFFIMETQNKNLGENGIFIFSDCGLIVEPTENELIDIVYSSVDSFRILVEREPKVALLSYSTYGSAKGEKIDKLKNVLNTLNERGVDFDIDGELQIDAAIIKDVAKRKASGSSVAGNANVLIFPNLEAGNIGYKIAERFGNMLALGPITQGMNKPVNDLSRGSNIEEIVGVIAITAVQAANNI